MIGTLSTKPERTWQRVVFGRRPRRTLIRVLVLTLTTYLLFQFFLVPIKVVGNSMFPTYHDGKLNLVNKTAYMRTPPQRRDVVALRSGATNALLLKRIVGLPGERVGIRRGKVEINGAPLDEPYANAAVPGPVRPHLLGPDEFFVIGDNRAISIYGTVSKNQIVGKVLF